MVPTIRTITVRLVGMVSLSLLSVVASTWLLSNVDSIVRLTPMLVRLAEKRLSRELLLPIVITLRWLLLPIVNLMTLLSRDVLLVLMTLDSLMIDLSV